MTEPSKAVIRNLCRASGDGGPVHGFRVLVAVRGGLEVNSATRIHVSLTSSVVCSSLPEDDMTEPMAMKDEASMPEEEVPLAQGVSVESAGYGK